MDEYNSLWTIKSLGEDDDLFDEIMSFDGGGKIKDWEPLAVTTMYPEGERELGNAPSFHPHIPVLDRKALDVLKDLIEDFAGLLPLRCRAGEFYALNVTEVLDCIDYEKSEYVMFRDGKRIMMLDKYVFRKDIVKGEHPFKIIDEPKRRPFVSDEFRQIVLDNDLKGFKFKLLSVFVK